MATARAPSRRHDVVLYGASGFVGRQTVAHFVRHGGGLRWALGGRSAERLEEVRRRAGADDAAIVVADAGDEAALDALAAQARIVLSTAGPFARHGSALVAACVRHGTQYVDITGETPWVHDLARRHHDEAARRGVRIVPGCGFDSVPSDLGAWLVANELQLRHGQRCVEAKACFSLRGGLNGGTFASLVGMIESGRQRELADPFLLNPAGTVPADAARHADPLAPHHDADFDAWLGPFIMGPINTRVVRRSAALDRDGPYAPGFRYQEYLRFGRGPLAAMVAAGTGFGSLAAQGALAFAPLRRLAAMVAPAPGEGPSERTMDGGSFRCELVGIGERGARVRGRIAGRGDPGNRATTLFVCESALALAHDAAALPGGARRGGVLTPATAFGAVLAARLRAVGMTVEPKS